MHAGGAGTEFQLRGKNPQLPGRSSSPKVGSSGSWALSGGAELPPGYRSQWERLSPYSLTRKTPLTISDLTRLFRPVSPTKPQPLSNNQLAAFVKVKTVAASEQPSWEVLARGHVTATHPSSPPSPTNRQTPATIVRHSLVVRMRHRHSLVDSFCLLLS